MQTSLILCVWSLMKRNMNFYFSIPRFCNSNFIRAYIKSKRSPKNYEKQINLLAKTYAPRSSEIVILQKFHCEQKLSNRAVFCPFSVVRGNLCRCQHYSQIQKEVGSGSFVLLTWLLGRQLLRSLLEHRTVADPPIERLIQYQQLIYSFDNCAQKQSLHGTSCSFVSLYKNERNIFELYMSSVFYNFLKWQLYFGWRTYIFTL